MHGTVRYVLLCLLSVSSLLLERCVSVGSVLSLLCLSVTGLRFARSIASCTVRTRSDVLQPCVSEPLGDEGGGG